VKIVDESVTADRFLEIGYHRLAGDAAYDSFIDKTTDNSHIAGKIAQDH
jgi:hypothetical protein